MEIAKNIENQKKELTSEKLEFLLTADYPQHAPLYILEHLWLATEGKRGYSEKDFFDKINPEMIFTVEDYIDRFCEKHNLKHPSNFSKGLVEKSRIIEDIVNNIKEAIRNKEDLRLIYGITLRFESDLGIKLKHIDCLEK